MKTHTRLPLVLCIAAVSVAAIASTLDAEQPFAAEAQAVVPQPIWATIGSAGTPDESSKPKLKFSGHHAQVKSSGDVVLRYNVRPDVYVAAEGNGLAMFVRFKDNGSKARVKVCLREVNVWDGSVTLIAWLDSNWYSANDYAQIHAVGVCDFEFDVTSHVYYVEVELDRANGHGKPELEAIQIFPYMCE